MASFTRCAGSGRPRSDRPGRDPGHGVSDDDRRCIVEAMTVEVDRFHVPVAAERVGSQVGWSVRTVLDVWRARDQ